MASSKLSGWSETGLAFGMRPPMATGVVHSSLDISSEHASAVAYSACCYHLRKNVGIISIVMTERELRQVQRQIGFADIVKCAHHATLEQAPEAIQVRGMDIPATYSPLA